MTRSRNSLFEQKITTASDSGNLQAFPSLSSCPSGTQLSCTGSNKVVSFRNTMPRVIVSFVTQSRGLHPEHEREEEEMVMPISCTLSYQHRSGCSLCHSAQEVPGKVQSPPSSAAPALSSSARDYVAREAMSLSSLGERAPPLVTPPSQEAAPSSCALARHLLAETRPGEKKEGKINQAARQSKPGRAQHCNQAVGLFGHRKAALVFQTCYPVLGVSLVCKNNLGARTEANVETMPLCKTEIMFSSGHQTVLLHRKIKWVVQKPFLALRGLNCVSLFVSSHTCNNP